MGIFMFLWFLGAKPCWAFLSLTKPLGELWGALGDLGAKPYWASLSLTKPFGGTLGGGVETKREALVGKNFSKMGYGYGGEGSN